MNPPKWTDKVETINVPPFIFKRRPTLPPNFSDTSHPTNYFKLLFTDSLITDIIRFTNKNACIEITQKCKTKPDYVDNQWSLDSSENITCNGLFVYLECCVILSVNPSRQHCHVFNSEPYLNNPGICSVFTLWQCMKIGHYFCMSDKSMEPPRDSEHYDKLCKFQPIVEHLNNVFPKFYHFGAHVVIDESTTAMKIMFISIYPRNRLIGALNSGHCVAAIWQTGHTSCLFPPIWEKNIQKCQHMVYTLT